MNRRTALLCMALLWGCADEPKEIDSTAKRDEVVTQVNSTVKEPMASMPEVEKEIEPIKKEAKPAPTKVTPLIKNKAKEVANPTVKKKIVQAKPEAKPKPIEQPAPSTFANISFDKMVHEFGEIDEGDKITHKFTFKNTGNAPLVIDHVDVSCGCTMPSYPIIPIGPGETGEIGVVYNSKGKFGTQKPSITIKTNARQPIVKLYLSGSIKHVFEKTDIDTTDTKG